MGRISLKKVSQQRDLLKREYSDYDIQYIEFKHKYFNRLYLEHLWMEPIYIHLNEYEKNLGNLPSKAWTKQKAEKIDEMYEQYEYEPLIFKKYLNKLLRNDPINNLIFLNQHLKYLSKQIKEYDSSSYDDEHHLQYLTQYADLLVVIISNELDWNGKKEDFKTLNLDMINEFWYYFNKDEDDLKEYIRNILIYPGNYTTLLEFIDYMRSYQVTFNKDYNAIDKNTNKRITELIQVTAKALSDWYDEIPARHFNTADSIDE
jgi:hypothetical protein